MNFLITLLTPLYELLIKKGINFLKDQINEWKKQQMEKEELNDALNEKDPIKRAERVKRELNNK